LWGDPRIDAIAVCTPAETHFTLAAAALRAGKHVFVEKPLCLERAEAESLVVAAAQHSLVLMVGHQLLYHPAIEWLRGVIADGHLGTPRRIACTRHNSGEDTEDVGPWWSLAPHDLSAVLYLLGRRPLSVSATQLAPQGAPGGSRWARAVLQMEGGLCANLSCAVGVGERRRRIVIEGDLGTAVFDDSHGAAALELYRQDAHGVLRLLPNSAIPPRRGLVPGSDPVDARLLPLRLECQHFVQCCLEGTTPRTSGLEGLAVVELLEAGARSMRRGAATMSWPIEGPRPALR
jgi:UDP-2-acetamido-3-amino-2,3-dideoxy-glucuronate N-acetyltransferase